MIDEQVFKTPYQEFIFKRTYSRWLEDEGRRETWFEAVSRFGTYMAERVPDELYDEWVNAVAMMYNQQVMPSMRAFWTAGEALDVDNVAAYNCAYTTIDRVRALPEILYILMCGTGVGFSTEKKYVEQLPKVPLNLSNYWFDVPKEARPWIVVEDSRRGWAEAYEILLKSLYEGEIPEIDYTKIRPKGARLKTFGGRASGYEPLKELFDFTIETFKEAAGRKLKTIEVYDIVTTIASIVIAGGVRRSATINLSDLEDEDIKNAKVGEFWIDHPNRSLANNSAVYESKPDQKTFLEEWTHLATSGTGERGIINRQGLTRHVAEQGRSPEYEFGLNPCGEVILRPNQFCNLSEAVVRPRDSLMTLKSKVYYATVIGVLQSTLTDFDYISDLWKDNVEEERLLGVSLTGLKDHDILGQVSDRAKMWLEELREVAHHTAIEWSDAMGLPTPKAVTSVKPSGTVSQLVDSASGIHPRHSKYYVRRVRVAKKDPIADFLMAKGVPAFPEVGTTWDDADTVVFEFPVKAPYKAVLKGDESAIEQLEYWKMVKTYWTDHNPSQTISVKHNEWLEVGQWLYDNFDIANGLSFLEYDGGVYDLAPYQRIDKEEYERRLTQMPDLDWDDLEVYEQYDQTTGSRSYACVGGACEI